MARKTEVTERNVLTVRLSPELHEQLRAYKFFTHRPINELVVGLIAEYLAGPGREEIENGMTERAKEMYGVALDKLADM
jgi:hypothetical protein